MKRKIKSHKGGRIKSFLILATIDEFNLMLKAVKQFGRKRNDFFHHVTKKFMNLKDK